MSPWVLLMLWPGFRGTPQLLVDLEDELQSVGLANDSMKAALASKTAESQAAIARSQKAADTQVEELDRVLGETAAENKRWAAGLEGRPFCIAA